MRVFLILVIPFCYIQIPGLNCRLVLGRCNNLICHNRLVNNLFRPSVVPTFVSMHYMRPGAIVVTILVRPVG